MRRASSRHELKVGQQISKFGQATMKLKTRKREREMLKISHARRIEVSNEFMCEEIELVPEAFSSSLFQFSKNYWQDNSGQVVF